MTALAKFKQADLTRAIKGAKAAGVSVEKVEIVPDGTIKIFSQSEHYTDKKGKTGWEDA